MRPLLRHPDGKSTIAGPVHRFSRDRCSHRARVAVPSSQAPLLYDLAGVLQRAGKSRPCLFSPGAPRRSRPCPAPGRPENRGPGIHAGPSSATRSGHGFRVCVFTSTYEEAPRPPGAPAGIPPGLQRSPRGYPTEPCSCTDASATAGFNSRPSSSKHTAQKKHGPFSENERDKNRRRKHSWKCGKAPDRSPGPFLMLIAAVTYSPTQSPVQYHRRWRA